MPVRPILHFDIDARQETQRDAARPDDVVLRRRDEPVLFPQRALAYCADLQSERVLFTTHGAPARLFGAPFLYDAQLADASHVVSVPYERLDDAAPPGPLAPPTLIFSAGRTGSTLLARLLLAAGAPCASEPAMLAQVARFGREDRLRMGMEMEPELFRACLLSLSSAADGPLFVKLASHCNARCLALLNSVPGSRAVFLLRQAETWARSRHRAFGEDAVTVAFALRVAADALDKLLGEGGLQVIWFEELRANPARILSALLGRPVAPDQLLQATADDSQDGTPLARDALRDAEVADGFDPAFRQAWAEARAGAQWSAATEALLEQAFEP